MVGNICEIRDGPSGLRFYFLDFGFDLNLFVDYFLSRMVGKVCVIGGGPSGLGILCWFAKLKREGKVRLGKFGIQESPKPSIVSLLDPKYF